MTTDVAKAKAAEKTETTEAKTKTCFIVTPIGADDSEIRRAVDGVIDAVIEPVLNSFNFGYTVAHRMVDAGSITKQVISELIESDLVICNLTNLNPNVMYELAVRHAVRKPVVCIALKGTKIPFDIQDDRVIFYENDMQGAMELRFRLEQMVPSALEDIVPDNPIYRATESEAIMQKAQGESSSDEFILRAVERLERKVHGLDLTLEGKIQDVPRDQQHHFSRVIFEDDISKNEIATICNKLIESGIPVIKVDVTERFIIVDVDYKQPLIEVLLKRVIARSTSAKFRLIK